VRAGWSQCCNGREDEEEARYGKSTNQSRASFVLKSLSSILTDSDPDDGRDDSLTDIQPFFDEQGEQSELLTRSPLRYRDSDRAEQSNEEIEVVDRSRNFNRTISFVRFVSYCVSFTIGRKESTV
jgi:hypothetical protein